MRSSDGRHTPAGNNPMMSEHAKLSGRPVALPKIIADFVTSHLILLRVIANFQQNRVERQYAAFRHMLRLNHENTDTLEPFPDSFPSKAIVW